MARWILKLLTLKGCCAVNHPEKIPVYLALIDGEPAGTISLHLGHYSTWNDYWYRSYRGPIVWRRNSDGSAAHRLLLRIKEVAAQCGLGRVELLMLNNNIPARRLYEQSGFTTDSAVYDLPIEQ
ncbi:MAG: GNAT family N-acetyltransferase [Firmicutes bacterium]|nr:GNAT family N-acetyltransferase [Bacillota bacterium]